MAKYFIDPFAVDGDITAIPDAVQPSGSVSYSQGFTVNYTLVYPSDPSALPFPRRQFNGLMNDITLNIQQYQQHGTPEFISTADNGGTPFPYEIYSLVRYDDGGGYKIYQSKVGTNTTLPTNTTNWLALNFENQIIVPGTLIDFAGNAVPAGYLLCDGSAVSRTIYAALFAAIGVVWGPGDGSTTFNIPNLARRTTIGEGGTGTGTIGSAVGNIGGEENHALTAGENGTHNHSGSCTVTGDVAGSFPNGITMGADHTTGQTKGSNISMPDSGSGTPHNTIQPSAVVLKVIKI